jgi:glycosyltransferase involved in cell wall biosynthesis
MTRLRLVFITRRFWPLVGGAEMAMAHLASAMQEAGHQVTILTASWNPDWPQEILHRGVRVVRMAQPNQEFLGTWRYLRGISSWLKRNRDQFELVYVSMLKHDAYAAIGTGRQRKFPVVLRAEGGGETGDIGWQKRERFGRWIAGRCRQAAAVVTPGLVIQQELVAAGYPVDRVHLIPNGVTALPPRTPERRIEAREAIGTAHAVLSLGRDTTLAVYTGRLSEEQGLTELVEAWAHVLRQRSNARLWLVGEGPLRDRLAVQIERLQIRGRCVLVGTFDSVEELLAAADLFIQPSREEGMSLTLLEAMAVGLPIVACDIPGNRALIQSGENGLLTPPGRPTALAMAIESLLNSPERAAQYGAAARERAQQHFAIDETIRQHEVLFASCLSTFAN